MADPEAQVERTAEVLEELATRGQEWVSLEEVALQAMIKERAHRRNQRSRGANSIRDLFVPEQRLTKPSRRFRRETSQAIAALEEEGRVEHCYVDDDGQVQEQPPTLPRIKDRRYRFLFPEATT